MNRTVRTVSRVFDLAALAFGLVLVARLLRIWAIRLPYPYDLEWMEGGMLVHAWRLEHGRPLYVEPGPDFIPFIYPPGYPAVLAAFGDVVGLSAAAGRSLSLIGTFAATAAIVFIVGRHGRSWTAGALGAMVFLGCYPDSGAFFDLVRTDALYVGLLAWAVALGLERTRTATVASGMLLAAAVLFKHTAALFGPPLAFAIAMRDGPRAAARFVAASVVPSLLVTAWVQWRSDGRFLTWILAVPASHPVVGPRVFPGAAWETAGALPLAILAVAAVFVVFALRRDRSALAIAGIAFVTAAALGNEPVMAALSNATQLPAVPIRGIPQVGFVLSAVGAGSVAAVMVAVAAAPWRGRWQLVYGGGVVVVALATAALMRGHHGGFLNVFVHAHWALSLAFAVGIGQWRARYGSVWSSAITAMLFRLQIAWCARDVGDGERFLPTDEERATGDALVARLAAMEGPVLSPYAPWLPVLAGHEPAFHMIALWDVDVAQHPNTPFPGVRQSIVDAMCAHRWRAVLDGPRTMEFGVQRCYQPGPKLPTRKGEFGPKTGWRASPRELMLPRE